MSAVENSASHRPAYLYLRPGELHERAERAVAALAECRVCPRDCRVNRLEDKWAACAFSSASSRS